MRRVLLWFRQDLRLHDNEALQDALRIADEVIPVYIFDSRIWQGHTKTGFPKVGPHRARFVLDSVADLRDSLRSLGSDLIVRTGISEVEIFDIARQVRSSNVFCNRDRTQEEVDVQDALEQKLWTIGQELKYSRGRMLYYTADLPFPVNQTPDTFNAFRKEVEKIVQIRPPLPVASIKPSWSCAIESGDLPSLNDFGIVANGSSVPSCVGGEAEGLKRAKNLIWNSSAGISKAAVEDQFTADLSSICSPWLSSGSLSPKKLYEELRDFEEKNGANELTHNLFTDLLIRDFHRFIGKKYGNKIFQSRGIRGQETYVATEDQVKLNAWINGNCGMPLIDAHMRELKATGFLPFNSRSNVANYLIQELKLPWLQGAEYFESVLIDYDPCSNYGNWMNLAGVGTESKIDRPVNLLTQTKRKDPKGLYVSKWTEVASV